LPKTGGWIVANSKKRIRISTVIWIALIVALLVGTLGTAALASQAPGAAADGAPAGRQMCYTLDTSRPEWLTRHFYLPIILRNG
jgi:hypothetical protein